MPSGPDDFRPNRRGSSRNVDRRRRLSRTSWRERPRHPRRCADRWQRWIELDVVGLAYAERYRHQNPIGREHLCVVDEVIDELVRISTVGDRETRVVAHHDGVEIARLPASAGFMGELGQRVCRHAVNPRRAEVDGRRADRAGVHAPPDPVTAFEDAHLVSAVSQCSDRCEFGGADADDVTFCAGPLS